MLHLEKRSVFLWTCLVVWLALALRYNPMMMPLFHLVSSWPARILMVFPILWINLLWFYAVYHTLTVITSVLSRPVLRRRLGEDACSSCPKAAILYTVCNDFCAAAALSCVKQQYDNFTVFLLDDSTLADERAKVDAFARAHDHCCVVIRRPDRRGFKAGNLNHALSGVAGGSKYFAIVDADEVLPADFLVHTVTCCEDNPQLGFVQANHRFRSRFESRFERDLSDGVDLHWGLSLPARNRFGFVLFYGHGALIRTRAWREVGGLPEMACEDIAFTTRLREYGYHGVFLKTLIASEAFPASYEGFLRREIRILKGTLQFLFGSARSFLRAGNVSSVEKADMLISLGTLFLPVAFVGYLLLANVILPLLVAHESLAGFCGVPVGWRLFLQSLEPLGAGIEELWTWDFYCLTVMAIGAPLVYQIHALRRSPLRFCRYLFQSTAVFLSIIPSLFWGAVTFIMTRRVSFTATGDRARRGAHSGNHSTHLAVAFGLLFTLMSLATGNIALLTIAASFLLHRAICRYGWENPAIRICSFVPFIFLVVVFGAIPALSLGVIGVLASVVPAHH
ncbi:MAG: glycosyltransferase [Candidatus Eisenbacteria sp.]|nr:glycosyltransferase [Candidatus Eisenbacteria bacterium]